MEIIKSSWDWRSMNLIWKILPSCPATPPVFLPSASQLVLQGLHMAPPLPRPLVPPPPTPHRLRLISAGAGVRDRDVDLSCGCVTCQLLQGKAIAHSCLYLPQGKPWHKCQIVARMACRGRKWFRMPRLVSCNRYQLEPAQREKQTF